MEDVVSYVKIVAKAFCFQVDVGRDIIVLILFCVLMMKFEWPLIVPDDEDVAVLFKAIRDIIEYIVDIVRNEGLVEGLLALFELVVLYLVCHVWVQNMGQKVAEMLCLISEADFKVIE